MHPARLRQVLGALPAIALMLPTWAPPPVAAAAQPCPDVEVVFARGTFEPPGVGATGQAFIDALQGRLPGRPIDVYPVNYPASLDFPRAADGVADASTKIVTLVNDCPNTRIVLGGYSQGAAVAAYTTTDALPSGYVLPTGINGPMPADISKHVAAVVLFAMPTNDFVGVLDRNAPPITIGARYSPKTLQLCVPDDPICSPTGGDQSAHGAYTGNGMTDQGADFAAHALGI